MMSNNANLFLITVEFGSGLTPAQQAAFVRAARLWMRAIIKPLPPVEVDGRLIDGLVISVRAANIDGPNRVLGRAGPTYLRPANAGAAAYLPATGQMIFDAADLSVMEEDGRLETVIAHEMGHVLGIGTDVWTKKDFVRGYGTADPTFQGPQAMIEYGVLTEQTALPVPLENRGGKGVANVHWRETVFGSELMSSVVLGGTKPLSKLTLASLHDLGYEVDYESADPYELPLAGFVEKDTFKSAPKERGYGRVLPTKSLMLPESSLK